MKIGENLYLHIVCADRINRKLYVPKAVMDKAHILKRAESQLYFTYRNRYPDFEFVVIWENT